MADVDRLYDILRTQGETLASIVQGQLDTKERLFGSNGQPGELHFLKSDIAAIQSTFRADLATITLVVERHSSQIHFWRGALAVAAFLWTTMLAWGGFLFSKHR